MHSLKAEAMARKQCEAGLASYLADKHKQYRRKSLAAGILGGGVAAFGLSFVHLKMTPLQSPNLILVPLLAGGLFGFGYGAWTQDDDDAMREVEFNEQCQEFEAEDEICECGYNIGECECEDCEDCGCERSL